MKKEEKRSVSISNGQKDKRGDPYFLMVRDLLV
jgi:hypothetical protein